MKPAPLAAALVLLGFAGCRSSSAPPAPPAPSSTASEALPSAEPSAVVAEPGAEPSASAVAADLPPPAALPRPLVRERAEIAVDGVKEEWRIEWTTPPSDACFDYDERNSCLCGGLTFGEAGEFDVIRARPGLKEQRAHLSGTLQRWPRRRARALVLGRALAWGLTALPARRQSYTGAHVDVLAGST